MLQYLIHSYTAHNGIEWMYEWHIIWIHWIIIVPFEWAKRENCIEHQPIGSHLIQFHSNWTKRQSFVRRRQFQMHRNRFVKKTKKFQPHSIDIHIPNSKFEISSLRLANSMAKLCNLWMQDANYTKTHMIINFIRIIMAARNCRFSSFEFIELYFSALWNFTFWKIATHLKITQTRYYGSNGAEIVHIRNIASAFIDRDLFPKQTFIQIYLKMFFVTRNGMRNFRTKHRFGMFVNNFERKLCWNWNVVDDFSQLRTNECGFRS